MERLRRFAEWLERHAAACVAQVDTWTVSSLPVPTELVARVWPTGAPVMPFGRLSDPDADRYAGLAQRSRTSRRRGKGVGEGDMVKRVHWAASRRPPLRYSASTEDSRKAGSRGVPVWQPWSNSEFYDSSSSPSRSIMSKYRLSTGRSPATVSVRSRSESNRAPFFPTDSTASHPSSASKRLPPVSAQNNTVSLAAPDLNSPAAANMSKAVGTSRSRKPKWHR